MMRKVVVAVALAAVVLTISSAYARKVASPEKLREWAARDAADKSNAFGADLYAKLSAEKGNIFLSPYSISTALLMTAAGARENTAVEMATVLHWKDATDRDKKLMLLRLAISGDAGSIYGGSKPSLFQLNIANALWPHKDYALLPRYTKVVGDTFGADVQALDYTTDAEAARKIINAWGTQQTGDNIWGLLPRNSLNAQTRLVLTNTVLFKAAWLKQFSEKASRDEAFTFAPGKRVTATMMHQTADFDYAENDEYQALYMHYAGGRQSMVVILPRKIDGLAALEKDFTSEKLAKLVQRPLLDQWQGEKDASLDRTRGFVKAMEARAATDAVRKLYESKRASGAPLRTRVKVSLPKFKFRWQQELGKPLQAMGMKDAFGPKADFSGMTGTTDLYISQVAHKTFVEVTENGTEAAAATAVVAVEEKEEPAPEEPKVFKADHPFLFFIRDRSSGAILFMGRVTSPTGYERLIRGTNTELE